jgi:uncharacterized membrane protein
VLNVSPHHPIVVKFNAQRAADIQLRIADHITAYAGSMRFVYLHAGLFAAWMLIFEKSPWPTLTLVVSLEAIFLSTFVMIGQNRQAAFQQAKADHDFVEEEQELKENTQLTRGRSAIESWATKEGRHRPPHDRPRQSHARVTLATRPGRPAAGDDAAGFGDPATCAVRMMPGETERSRDVRRRYVDA